MPIVEDNSEYQVIETVSPRGSTTQVVWKPGSRGANTETLLGKAKTALTANATYLALASPTAAQTTAQTKLLTRECNALIRLLLQELQDVSDT